MKKEKGSLMKIASVKLVSGGFCGCKVVYEKTMIRNGRTFIKNRTEENGNPVHGELIDLFEGLGNNLLDICGYTTNERERKQLLNELEVTGVTAGMKGFVLSGKLRVLGIESKKVVSLTTPLVVESDCYGEYDEVMKTIDSIYKETEAYMSGAKVFSDKQLVIKFNKNDDEMKSVFEGLDEEGKKKMATDILEKLGSVVIHNDDMEQEELAGMVVEMKEQNSFIENDIEFDVDVEDEELNFDLVDIKDKN